MGRGSVSRAADLHQEALAAGLLLSANGDRIHVESPLGLPLPDELKERLDAHRGEVLAYLAWCERADVMLLETSRRISERCPCGCPLEGEAWREAEEELGAAHRSQDHEAFCKALLTFEHFAHEQFAAYEMERRHE